MRILLDNCVDVRCKKLLSEHDVVHARDMGWQELGNGKLLSEAEAAGFRVFITVDKNLRHQQNLSKRQISVVTLSPKITEFEFIASLVETLNVWLSHEIAPGSDIVLIPGDTSIADD